MEVIRIYTLDEFDHQAFASNLNRIQNISKVDIGKLYYIEIKLYNDGNALISFRSNILRNETYEEWSSEWKQMKKYAEKRYGA